MVCKYKNEFQLLCISKIVLGFKENFSEFVQHISQGVMQMIYR